jgi:NitT/TauT family transport system permease protein
VGREFLLIVSSGHSWRVIAATLSRIALTFGLDLFLALLLGIPAGLHEKVEQIIRPVESTMRTIPTMGVVLLALIWLDTELTPIFVSSLIVFPILYRSVVDGIRNIDQKLVEFHSVHQVPFRKRLRCFYIPSLLPFLKTGTIASMGLGFKVMITAEVLSQPDLAVGTIFQIERAQLNTAGVMAWCVYLIAVASLFEYIIQNFSRITRRKAPVISNET